MERAEGRRKKPIPGEIGGRRGADVIDRQAAQENDGKDLERGQNHLRSGADRDAEGDERQHAEEPDGPGAGRPHNVVAQPGREKVERRLSCRERRGDIEDRRGAEERPPGKKTQRRVHRAANPNIGRPSIRPPPVQIGKSDGDADDWQRRDPERRRSGEAGRGNEGGGGDGNRIGRSRSRDSHRQRVEKTKRSLSQRTFQ